ncbi:MAG: hydrogenase nickel incorporation protein HypB [Anaerolineales bacterium]
MTSRIDVAEKILSANDELAIKNMKILNDANVFGINIMASPGAGKTTFILKTLESLGGRVKFGVIEGDLASSIDSDKAKAAGIPAVQINTGGECHLDSVMLSGALNSMDLSKLDLLIVENVGNLVCPINFKIGTHMNILVASIPEGDDKPYKYPGSYRGVEVLVISKIDLLPYVPFDMEYFKKGVGILNPGLITFEVSAKSGEGMALWGNWLVNKVNSWKENGNK